MFLTNFARWMWMNCWMCWNSIRNTHKKKQLQRALHNILNQMKKAILNDMKIRAMKIRIGVAFLWVNGGNCGARSFGTSKLNPSVKWINNDVPTYTKHGFKRFEIGKYRQYKLIWKKKNRNCGPSNSCIASFNFHVVFWNAFS